MLFGASFLTAVTAVTALARRLGPVHAITATVGGLTVSFAVGQCAGPVLAGPLSDGSRGLQAGLTRSATILAAGTLVALAQKEPKFA